MQHLTKDYKFTEWPMIILQKAGKRHYPPSFVKQFNHNYHRKASDFHEMPKPKIPQID